MGFRQGGWETGFMERRTARGGEGMNTLYRGDNLAVLRGMDSETVDLIYLDPPFNTRKPQKTETASYRDTWQWADVDEYDLAFFAAYKAGAAEYIRHLGSMGFHPGMQAYAAFMAPRLLELHRVLKPTGSMYLHCDPHANMVLRHLCDAIYGERNMRREIVWEMPSPSGYKTQARNWVRGHDTLFYYVKSDAAAFVRQYKPYREEYLRNFRHVDEDGLRYWLRQGKRRYLGEGILVHGVWDDIPSMQTQSVSAAEGVGYPTQKPLKLMYRILQASSKPGDVVLDPFCGCVTMPIAAAQQERRFIGIDEWDEVEGMMLRRIAKELGFLPEYEYVDCVSDPSRLPRRTDVEPFVRSNPAHFERLMVEQGGRCNASGADLRALPRAMVHVDRIIPGERPGYVFGNVQLLTAEMNMLKGNRPMAYLMRRLAQQEFRFPGDGA